MGMFSSLCFSVLFLFHWVELWLLSPWLRLLILLLLSPSVPQQLCPPSSTKACLQLCHPVHPTAAVCPCSQGSVLVPCASPSAAAAAWLCPAEPLPLWKGACLLLPGLCPPPWLGAGMLSPLPLPLLPPAPLLASPHPQQLPSSLCGFGSRPFPHPGQPGLGPHPRSQPPAAFPARFQQLFPGTCPALL